MSRSRSQASEHKYLTVRAYLADLVASELSVGDAVPSERSLTEKFGVSRMTVRQAVDALVTEGVLERAQGRGTFVAPPRADFEMRLTTFGEEARRRGMEPGTEVLEVGTVPAPASVAESLGRATGDPMHHVVRLRTADGSPMSVEEAWIPVDLAPDLLDDGVPESLYGALRERGLAPTWGEDTITASDATVQEQKLLGLRASRAVMRTVRRTFAGDSPLMYSRSSYRGDRYSVFVPLREARPTLVPRSTTADDAAAADGGAVTDDAPTDQLAPVPVPARATEGNDR
ncbi:transcriptional regulator, GntR family [Cellulosimicrobium aquatile]|uniref:Transcriptional regulator, GntR family n=1 Tax=Cellulosimicrobium aquatile TaxID=1612203 RepID=A0A1N6NQK9_9MICO|nr:MULTISPECIES: GntR family transcriptional regulator [Cellulosimicrobium]MCM3533232.1 GntR family transcriptional regulator [Cellulosimicrobium funkei]NMF29483.1 GntR family transcriptional regulator [Cellulosimicrobium aquatile]SIP94418.1 transcriptional regulator, GntR family [Cellulosimicrobium aquatile]